MKAYKAIGNAVPGLLGYLVAEKVSDIFNHLKANILCDSKDATETR